MAVEIVIETDDKMKREKYILFLDYVLKKLKNGRTAGISLRNLSSDYKTEMGTTIGSSEQKEFLQLYDGKWFNKEAIDRIKITRFAIDTLAECGNVREYFNKYNNQDLSSLEPTNNHQSPHIIERKQSKRHATIVLLMIIGLIVAIIAGWDSIVSFFNYIFHIY